MGRQERRGKTKANKEREMGGQRDEYDIRVRENKENKTYKGQRGEVSKETEPYANAKNIQENRTIFVNSYKPILVKKDPESYTRADAKKK